MSLFLKNPGVTWWTTNVSVPKEPRRNMVDNYCLCSLRTQVSHGGQLMYLFLENPGETWWTNNVSVH